MRCAVLVLMLAGCGRIGFGDSPEAADAHDPPTFDSPIDPPDPSLVVHLALDDNPADGLDNRGTPTLRAQCVEGCPSLVDGMRGQALLFGDGVRGLEILDAPQLRPVQGTIAAWVRFDSFPVTEWRMVFSKPFASSLANSLELYLKREEGNLIFGGGGDADDSVRYVETMWIANAGVWTHVALTWNATSTTLYVDGVSRASGDGYVPVYDASEVLLGVERDDETYRDRLYGALDDVRVYSRVLPANEIAELAAR